MFGNKQTCSALVFFLKRVAVEFKLLCFFKREQKGRFAFSPFSKGGSVTLSFFLFNEAVSFFDCVYTLWGSFTVPHKNKRVTSDMRSRFCGCCFFESQLNCNQFILQKHTGDTTKCAPFFKTTCENNFFESRVFCKSQSERFGLFFSFVDRDSHISVSVVLSL